MCEYLSLYIQVSPLTLSRVNLNSVLRDQQHSVKMMLFVLALSVMALVLGDVK